QWIANENQGRLEIYREFIEIASKCYIHALQHDEPDISGLVGLYANISRMQVLSSAEIVEKANTSRNGSSTPIPSPTRASASSAVWSKTTPSTSCTISARHAA